MGLTDRGQPSDGRPSGVHRDAALFDFDPRFGVGRRGRRQRLDEGRLEVLACLEAGAELCANGRPRDRRRLGELVAAPASQT